MSRDMKPRKSRSPGNRKKSGGGTLIGLFLGLVIGVVAAAGVVWYLNKSPTPFADKSQRLPSTTPEGTNGTPTPPAPLTLPGKPGDPTPQPTAADDGKPRFDFYKILPGNAEAIPDPKAANANQSAPTQSESEKDKQAKEGVLKDPVYLQTGSFQNAADADNQKAKLALMGAEASVQQVMLQDKVWYRVRLGPFKKTDEVSKLRAELASQGIDANIVKKD